MRIDLTLNLPRDEATLPLVRHLCKFTMQEIGVAAECISDIELAITEACANVVEHSSAEDEFEVRVEMAPKRCDIRIVDTGRGFDFESFGRDNAAADAEGGRGIQLMRALVDRVGFSSEPEKGTVVHLVKHLTFDDAPRYIDA